MDQQTTIGNVCFICDEKNGKILFLKRANDPMKGMYTGVGGKTLFAEDINFSCRREIKEETGLEVKEIKLKGVLKTILEGKNSSWILFVYVANDFTGKVIDCDEGQLEWKTKKEVLSLNLIGFIRRILPNILNENEFVEGTILHDIEGNVLKEKINSHFF
jgi:8-oxo-dGTP diphosphatase